MKKFVCVSVIAILGLVGILGMGSPSVDAASKVVTVKSSTVEIYNAIGWRVSNNDYWRTIYYNSYCYQSGQSSVRTPDGGGYKITTTYHYDYR
ncbi:hypothetical protein [Enterococcus casseliflavus]|uniref:hypothetical protein n=1 Tax=Enterococcus casseliflavus TaxID=37734 RepID=UPI001C470D4B|nr:hypothetical protein [Enterococcus casseliflavus]MBV6376454.1 hypothetical protein [Enterococcus casseliflavus]